MCIFTPNNVGCFTTTTYTSTIIGLIVIKSCPDIDGSHRINLNDFSDSLTFPLATP